MATKLLFHLPRFVIVIMSRSTTTRHDLFYYLFTYFYFRCCWFEFLRLPHAKCQLPVASLPLDGWLLPLCHFATYLQWMRLPEKVSCGSGCMAFARLASLAAQFNLVCNFLVSNDMTATCDGGVEACCKAPLTSCSSGQFRLPFTGARCLQWAIWGGKNCNKKQTLVVVIGFPVLPLSFCRLAVFLTRLTARPSGSPSVSRKRQCPCLHWKQINYVVNKLSARVIDRWCATITTNTCNIRCTSKVLIGVLRYEVISDQQRSKKSSGVWASHKQTHTHTCIHRREYWVLLALATFLHNKCDISTTNLSVLADTSF